MSNMKTVRIIALRPINSLKPHPTQANYFADLNDVEYQVLCEDMKKNGLNNPIEILRDGTIVAGHQRVRVAKQLGWKEIRCWVRKDLEQQGAAAIESRLIEDNLHRRHLSELTIARCYLRLKELAQKNGYDGPDANQDLRDHLAPRFKRSGKQLERYVKMLDAPIAVQHAFDAGKLTQKDVLAVAALEPHEQQRIAEQIDEEKKPKEVVAPYVQRQQAREVGVETAIFRLTRAIGAAELQLEDRLHEIEGRRLEFQLDKLIKGVSFIQNLHKKLKQKLEEESVDYDQLDDTSN